jgi:hypothetical protein
MRADLFRLRLQLSRAFAVGKERNLCGSDLDLRTAASSNAGIESCSSRWFYSLVCM